jgi:predicted enzyme related to lactoylglutathione lyase
MNNAFSYIELHSQAPERAKEFYQSLFGWKMTDQEVPGFGTYTGIAPPEGPGGGLMKAQDTQQPSTWVVYVNVEDLAAATAKVWALGEHGTMAVVADPSGAVFNLWQEAR